MCSQCTLYEYIEQYRDGHHSAKLLVASPFHSPPLLWVFIFVKINFSPFSPAPLLCSCALFDVPLNGLYSVVLGTYEQPKPMKRHSPWGCEKHKMNWHMVKYHPWTFFTAESLEINSNLIWWTQMDDYKVHFIYYNYKYSPPPPAPQWKVQMVHGPRSEIWLIGTTQGDKF